MGILHFPLKFSISLKPVLKIKVMNHSETESYYVNQAGLEVTMILSLLYTAVLTDLYPQIDSSFIVYKDKTEM